jgi:hypothetical protein
MKTVNKTGNSLLKKQLSIKWRVYTLERKKRNQTQIIKQDNIIKSKRKENDSAVDILLMSFYYFKNL